MAFEVGKNVQREAIERNTLRQAEGMRKLSEEKFNAIWDKFDTNRDGVLEQDEQVALMAFMDQLSGEDDKVTRKEAKAKKKELGADMSYKDYKRMSKGLSQVVDKNPNDNVELKKAQGDNQYTVNQTVYRVQDNQVRAKLDENGHVKYDYNENGSLKTKTTTKSNDESEVENHDENGKLISTKTTNSEGETTVSYDQTGKNKLKEVKANKDKTVTTTTTYQPGTNTPVKTVEVDTTQPNTTKTTTTTPQGKTVATESGSNKKTEEFDSGDKRVRTEEIQDGIKTTTDYKAKTRTTDNAKDKKTTVETFDKYDEKTGDISDIKKTVETDKTKHIRSTKEGKSTTVEKLDAENKNTIKTVKVDTESKKITQTSGGKTVTLDTDETGNVLINASWNDSKHKMETVSEAAKRIGLREGTQAYNDFIKHNGGANATKKPGEQFKIPNSVVMNPDTNINFSAVKIEATVSVQKAKVYKQTLAAMQARHEAEIKARTGEGNYQKAADKALANWDKKGSTRCTYATDNYRVFCDKTKNDKGYNQHYIYSAYHNKMVPIESLVKDPSALNGKSIRFISANGKATLTDGTQIILDLDDNKIRGREHVRTYKNKDEMSPDRKKEFEAIMEKAYEKINGQYVSAEEFLALEEDSDGVRSLMAANEPKETPADEEEALVSNDGTETKALTSEKVELPNLNDVKKAAAESNKNLYNKKYSMALANEKNPFVYYSYEEKKYYYYNPDTKKMEASMDIESINEDGRIKLTNDTYISNEQFYLMQKLKGNNDSFYAKLYKEPEKTETEQLKGLSESIKSKYNASNVIELYSSYKSPDGTMLQSVTQKNLTATHNNEAREHAYNIAHHIVSKLVERANSIPNIDKTNQAYTDAMHFVKNDRPVLFSKESYIAGSGRDRDLSWTADPIIRHLTELIENSSVSEQEEVSPEEQEILDAE